MTEPVPPDEPVLHVSWYEADAYARWAGRRLPTEAEWEKAARHDPATGRSRRFPWGDADPTAAHANLGQRHLRPAPVGSYPAGRSPLGVRQLIGDVWEWTSTDFTGYPGFAAFPYREYSEVFFGAGYKVLRGGSFGTDPVACRGTFRNWDLPVRRQIFAGFRSARATRGRGRGRLMCRHLAYLGPPVTLAEVLLDPPHSLLHQSWAPADSGAATVNADGFGVGWYTPAGGGTVRDRRAGPLWSDSDFADLARVIRTGALLAAVRSATVGMPDTEAAAAPFGDGRVLFSHNGAVPDWPGSMVTPAERLPVTRSADAGGPSDSALLWALLRRPAARRRRTARRPAGSHRGAHRGTGRAAESAADRRHRRSSPAPGATHCPIWTPATSVHGRLRAQHRGTDAAAGT